MKRWWMGLALAACLALGLAVRATAADYSFQLKQEVVNVYWETDGSAQINYTLVFVNDPSASPIDYVDIGLPTTDWSLSTVSADVDGQKITDIQSSSYVQNGAALGLGAHAIGRGRTGTVHVLIGRVGSVLHPDDQNANDASAVFSPTWFDSSAVHGSTDLTVIFHLPQGVQPNEPRYHTAGVPFPSQPQTALDSKGRVMYTWHTTTANGSTQYTLGASFPAHYVPADAIVRPSIFSGITDLVDSVLPSLGNCCIFGVVAAFLVGSTAFNMWSSNRRKLQYLPPKISIEGHGIKRGLTAVEAAALMEQPMDKVLTMILFSVIKKGAARLVSRDPLKLEAAQPLPAGLYPYETAFVQAFAGDAAARRKGLQAAMVALIKSVSDKMKGFSRKETVAYYQSIIEKAWQEVQAAATPDVKSQKFDEVMDWTMLDRDFEGRSRQVLGPGPVFVPSWWGRYSSPIHTSLPPMASSGGGGHLNAPLGGSRGGMALPQLPGADFAAAIAGGIQNFSSGAIGNLTDFTNSITQQTNPPPPPSSSSYHGGGGHCACACACAGCACACAGGGR